MSSEYDFINDIENSEIVNNNSVNLIIGHKKYSNINNEQRFNLARLVYDQGHSIKDASDILSINYNTARTILKTLRDQERIIKLEKGGKKRKILTEYVLNEIENIVSYEPGHTLKEIKDILESKIIGFSISTSTIHNGLEELKITLKLTHRELCRVNSPEKIALRKEYGIRTETVNLQISIHDTTQLQW